jgi:hypothetical protein
MTAIRHLTLWELLIWTYRDQKAAMYLHRPVDWFLWTLAYAGMVEDMPRPNVHHDAAMVHALVLEQPQHDAELLAMQAHDAERPELPTAEPRPFPVTPDRRDRDHGEWSWGVVNGRRIDYAIKVEEVLFHREPVFKRVGRTKSRIVGYRNRKVPIWYCPVDWVPSPLYLEMERARFANWTAAMLALFDQAKRLPLKDHALAGVGLDQPPIELPEQARVAQNEPSNKITCPTVALEPGTLVFHDVLRVYRRHARTETR